MKRIFHAAIIAALVASAPGVNAQTGNDLFQRALSKERAEGRLDEAIRIYERVVKEFATDRPLAAKALLQMGHCYERLGKVEAETAYGRLVREYADQRTLADEARVRLAALRPSSGKPTGLTTRAVLSGPDYVDVFGSIFPDGRSLSFTDWDTGDLAVRDLQSGNNRRLTGKQSWFASPEFAEASVVSPDGNQIAYAWSNKDGFYELRLIAKRGGSSRVLYRNDEVRYVEPFAWSPDGKQIAALFSRADKTNQLVLLAAAGGDAHALKTLDWRAPWKIAFSPDGRYIAYDFPPSLDEPARDLFLLATDGSREVALVRHPAHDILLGWVPNTDRVLFASDRGGTTGAWTIRVQDGRPFGDAELLKPAMGRVKAGSFSKAGDYYYALGTGRPDVYTATFDARTGNLTEEPRPLFSGRVEEGKQRAVWSPDGEQLAYLAQATVMRGEGATTLAISTLKTGHVQSIPLKMNYANGLQWLPDGRALLVQGRDAKDRRGLFRVDLPGGSFGPIVYATVARFAVAPDASRMFYERPGPEASGGGAIMMRDLRTGEEKEIYRFWSSCGLALSSDGRWLAVKANVRSGDGSVSKVPSIQVLSAAGGEPRTIVTLDKPDSSQWRQMAWSPDGKYVFFTEHDSELWQVPAAGGTPQRLATGLPFINGISVHPDGRQLAVSAGSARWELWVMENLLPTLKAATARQSRN